KQLMISIAVITNASLISLESVSDELSLADLVSVKVDTVDENTFHRLNRPYYKLELGAIFDGISHFAHSFKGTLITETMLVEGVNDSPEIIEQTAKFIETIHPKEAYISIPIRPPQDASVKPPDEEKLVFAYQTFRKYIEDVSLLSEAEEGSFSSTGNIAEDILSITSVHPMRQQKIIDLIESRGGRIEIIDELVRKNLLRQVDYNKEIFYIRNFSYGGKNGN
ncbi:MAG: radical SAM protein, partial [Caldisericaceae bacterium]